MLRIVVGLILVLISMIGIFRGFVWIFQAHFGWAFMNFLVYGISLMIGHYLLRSRRTIITRWVNRTERART